MKKSLRNWRDILDDRRGTVATIFGIVAIPTLLILGMGIDYGVATATRAKLDAAADAAGMAAITTAKTVIQGATGSADVTASAISQGQAAGLKSFAANAGHLGAVAVPIPSVTVTRTNQTLTATVSYSTSSPNTFGKIIGIPQTALGTTALSTLTMPTYINYYIIVDTSQSMGIGSTANDMQSLYNLVVANKNGSDGETGCVFGCHVLAPGQSITNEALAHNANPPITLRIDAAASAIQTIISQAQTAYTNSGQALIQLSLWQMQQDPTNPNTTGILQLAALEAYPFSNNLKAAKALDLGNNNSNGTGDTNFSMSLNYFNNNVLTTQGVGATQGTALNYVFIITDGVSDTENGSCQTCHVVTAFDPSLCQPIQAKATVGVLYTTYNPIYANNNSANGLEGNYAGLVSPIIGNVVPNLQTCASQPTSLWYYEATDGPAITAGMQKLFASTAQQARVSR